MGDLHAIRSGINNLVGLISAMPIKDRISAINECRMAIYSVSPFRGDPVDCVLWVEACHVAANDYNPNVVAPPEMRLLATSIETDGYTQPIVTYDVGNHREIVDGFHRYRIGTENLLVSSRTHGYIPVTTILKDRTSRENRVAATIRHNRARGRHLVDNMSEIVVELSRRGWSNEKIGHELGMEPDEVLRLKQISGLAELFSDKDFSEAWELP